MCVCVESSFGAFYYDSSPTVYVLFICMDVQNSGCLAALHYTFLVLHWSLGNNVILSYQYGVNFVECLREILLSVCNCKQEEYIHASMHTVDCFGFTVVIVDCSDWLSLIAVIGYR